ncbi:Pc21g10480 protein [Mycena venus]|uniref:Pc21g10480 protein n=1 Tax=Mycena venus TaxID=2733690 RepID=A0A8H6XYG0_9AGAR|nr:Pc21g10480 protein [Mycena venus]
MPIYTLNTRKRKNGFQEESFVKALTALHAETFHSDPAAVRVEFVIGPMEATRYRYGGYGVKPGTPGSGTDKATAHLVAQVVWNGSGEEWQEYCRKIVQLWGPDLRTIVLQRVEWEFEVVVEGRQGLVIGI